MSKKIESKKHKKVTKPNRPEAVDYKEFVKVWKKARSVSEVAESLGIKANSASAIAARLRRGKVELKKFPRRAAQPIDAKALNKV